MKVQIGEGKIVELPEGLSDEQISSAVDEIARVEGISADSGSTLGKIAKGAGDVLSSGSDAINKTINAALASVYSRNLRPLPERGDAAVRQLGEAAGIDMPQEGYVPQTPYEKGLDLAGTAAALAVPIGGAARALETVAAGTKYAAPIAKRIADASLKSPVKATVTEGLAGFGAGVGGEMARRAEGGDGVGSQVAELGGQLFGAVVPSAAVSLMPTSLAYRAGKAVKEAASRPFRTDQNYESVMQGLRQQQLAEGQQFSDGAISSYVRDRISSPLAYNSVAQRLKEVAVSSPDEIVRALEGTQNPFNLTPAMLTGDTGLIALEKAAASTADTKTLAKRAERIKNSRQLATMAIQKEAMGEPSAAKDFLQQRKDELLSKAEGIKAQAATKAEAEVDMLRPEVRRSEAAVTAREQIDQAFAKEKAVENNLWAQVPNVTVGTGDLKQNFAQYFNSIPLAQKDKVPAVARQLLGSSKGFGEQTNIKELQGLREELLTQARQARAAGDMQQARMAGEVADQVLNAMGAKAGAIRGEAGTKINEALMKSREVKEKFSQGAIGDVLSFERSGGLAVAPELTLDKIVGAGRIKGSVGIKELRAAVGDNPQAMQAVQQYIVSNAKDKIIKDGRINTRAAEKFIKDNEDIFDSFPEVSTQIAKAVDAERQLARTEGRYEDLFKKMNNEKYSYTAKYLNAPPSKKVEFVFNETTEDPVKAAQELRRLVRKDTKATEGVKASAIDYLLARSEVKGDKGIDVYGNREISGKSMLNFLNNRKNEAAFVELVGADAMKRIRGAAKALALSEDANEITALSEVISKETSTLIEYPLRTYAANIGANFGDGGASLQTASRASGLVKRFLDKMTGDTRNALLKRALFDDEELFKALMTKASTQKQKVEAASKLRAWLYSEAGQEFMRAAEQVEEEQ